MRRNNRLKTLGIIMLLAAALAVIRVGPWPSLFQQAVALITGLAGHAVDHNLLPYGDKQSLKKQAVRDRGRAMRLLRENAHLKQELRRLGFVKKVRPSPGSVMARITLRDPSHWFHRVVVDAGSSSGVKTGWIATTESGLAGRVTHCTLTTCDVRLIVDPDAVTSCVVHARGEPEVVAEDTDFFCMASGNVQGGLDIMVVSSSRTARAGDQVVTSGYGGQYPRGVPLGVVTGRSRHGRYKGRGFAVRPLADFRNLEYMLLSSP